MKKIITLLCAIASICSLSASDTQVDGIWYSFDNRTQTADVTFRGYSSSAYENEYVGTLVIPDTVSYNGIRYNVTGITDGAFYSCEGLISVTLPKSITSIEQGAFRYCVGLEELIVDEENTKFDSRDSCNAIIETLSNKIVVGCKNTIIPNSVTSIGYEAFMHCLNLSSITIPGNVKKIGSWAFGECYGLQSVVLNSGIEEIGSWAFAHCAEIDSVIIPDGVISIGSEAFTSCYDLKFVYIPNSVTLLSNHAFYRCNNLRHIEIPNGVSKICHTTFYGCSSLASVTIPNSVTEIEPFAFKECISLTSITIPSGVTNIDEEAFASCSGLKSVKCEAIEPPVLESFLEHKVFNDVDKSGITLYVPEESIELYRVAKEWNEFVNIRPIKYAEEADVATLQAEVTDSTAVISWPAINDATEYIIDIKNSIDTIYTMHFNDNGQLLDIVYPSTAPSRNGKHRQVEMATQTGTGWQYTITGLEPNTEYTYSVTAKQSDDSVAYKQSIVFSTSNVVQAIEQIKNNQSSITNKVLQNGQILFLRGDKTYTLQGQEVK